ncbi:putative tail protein [Synechococcus phage Ssp-JY39]|nr:gene transfer agent protein [Synechococcus phage Yong-M2-251]
MKLLRIAAWTVWFMLGWTALAHAGPVVAAIGGLIAAIKASALVQFLVGIALKVGASLIQRAMAKRQPQPGISGQLRVGGNNSFSFIVGDYATAGSLDYVGTWGRSGKTPNAYLTQVVTVSDMMQGGIRSRIFINNELCEIDFEATPVEQGYPVKEYRRNGRDYMWVKVLDGTQTEADPFLLDKFGSDPERPWTADMIGTGSTIVMLTALLNRELLTAMPVGRYEPLPLPLYDPRKDTTVGGDGAHRWGQPETYEATANLLVIAYNIERGIFANGEKVFGPGVSASRLPLPAWFAAMNECDVPTIVADGVGEVDPIYEPQFSGGYEIKVAEHEPADVLEELFKSCNGQIAENGGIYKPHVGAPGLPVMFLTDEDWIVTDPQELDPFKGLEQTFNGATATYPDPEAAWEMKDAPQRLFPDYEAEDDGRRLLADFQFNAVSSPTQVQRLMLSMVRDGRRMRFHRGTLPPVAFMLEPLDTISWTSARNGYIDKLFLISSKDEMTNVNQGVAAQEVDPSDYNWTPGTDKLPWSVGPINPRWPAPIPVAGWSVVASSINDESGTPRRPAIDLHAPGDNDDVRAIQIEVRNGEDELVFSGETPYGDVLADGQTKTFRLSGQWCLPEQPYTVRGRFLPYSGRELLWTGWMAVTTLNIRLGAGDIYPDGLIPDLQEFIDDAIDWIGPGVRELIDDARRLVASVLDMEAGNYTDRQVIRQEVVSSNADARAYALFQIEAATGPGSAIAQAILAVEAELEGKADASALLALTSRVEENEDGISALSQALIDVQAEIEDKADASAVLLLQARVDDVEGDLTSLSNAVIAVDAAVGDVSASGAFRAEALASPGGSWARIGLSASATSGSTFEQAALFLDARTSGSPRSRVVIVADQFAVSSGSTVQNPLVFDGTTLRLAGGVRAAWAQIDNVEIDWADIGTAVIGNLIVQDAMIPSNLITSEDDVSISNQSFVKDGTWKTVCSITLNSPGLKQCLLFRSGSVSETQGTSGSATPLTLGIRVLVDGVVIQTYQNLFSPPTVGSEVRTVTMPATDNIRLHPSTAINAVVSVQCMSSILGAGLNNQSATVNLVGQRNRH